ncbi:MAG: hypothetical protein E6J59_17665 [Deltaproteobacteria bacterium]|nr:MAG: hypothetical protein E6J59_17665 [Deltaproteobacteria bacterium]
MRLQRQLALVGAPVLALCLAAPAAAGSISISIAPLVELREGALSAQVKVSNVGDESAQSVAAVLVFGEHRVRGDLRPSLAPGTSMDAALTLPVGGLGTGRWPYQIAVDYTDANQYPFQAVHLGLVTVGSPPPAKVAVSELKADPLSSSGTLSIRVKNLAGVARQASVSVVAPEGIEVTAPTQEVRLAAWEERTVTAPIVNRTALVGSRYPLFAQVQYDEDGVHQTVAGQGMVEIEAAQSFLEKWRLWFEIVAGVLVAAWLGVLLWRAITSQSRRAETGR